MEMRAIEEIAIGEDLTSPLPPLAAVLHDSAVSSHCSACFSALPPQTFPKNSRHVPTDALTPLYCSLRCSSIDSALHSSSAERHLLSLLSQSPPSPWHDSSDLRLSLRLVHIFQNLPQKSYLGGKKEYFFQKNEETEGPVDYIDNTEMKNENLERIAGLMTNRENLVVGEIEENQFECDENPSNCEDCSENSGIVLQRIREGAKMMAKARRKYVGKDVNVEKQECFSLEEMVLCLVLTNAVEVQGDYGSSIGIAVYDATFSWINHSCSPNSCYRFLVGPQNDQRQPLRIAPAAEGDRANENGDGLRYLFSERSGYGPRVVVRSIKAVSKGEDVTIAYTDLLQPKEMRQTELWLKYRFRCNCKRCGAVPTTYLDYALQARPGDNPENPESSNDNIENLMQNFDDLITDYLAFGDAKSCCQKLEHLLCHGDLSDKSLEQKEAKSSQKVKLYPLHHLSLNAYTTLASAFKVQASDLLALSFKLEAFNMYKTSSAYYLLLAGVANHLFMFEPAIVPTVANFWINAGESLLNLARSSLWDAFLKRELSRLELSSLLNLKCNGCCVVDTLEPNSDQKIQLYNCIANVTPKIWSLLSSESNFLKLIQNPVDLSWLGSPAALEISDGESVSLKRSSQWETEVCNDQVRMNLILLSVHCLRYGALLSSICYGLSVETNYYRALEALMKT
ncbi:hypothetical protein C2S51_004174 [Perilla frutescens var. frutescens]|nr:hypothetical protein C2S51_004174 [Perilla frutescens var. frutescens]